MRIHEFTLHDLPWCEGGVLAIDLDKVCIARRWSQGVSGTLVGFGGSKDEFLITTPYEQFIQCWEEES